MANTSAASFRLTLRFLCASLTGSQVVLLLAVCAALGSDGFKSAPIWALAVIVVAGLASATVIQRFGFRVPAIAPGTPSEDARRAAARGIQSSTVVRFAIAEAVALVSMVLAFAVRDGGAVVCLIGVAFSLALSVLTVWPSDRVLNRLREGLEREGGQSELDAVLDAPPPSRSA